MRKMKIKIGGQKLNHDNRVISKKKITLRVDRNNDRLNKVLTVAAWAKVFDRLAIEFIYKPIVVFDGQAYTPDFYLKNLDIFVIVSDFKAKDVPEIFCNIAANKLAHATERDVVMCYVDGRFRLADYSDYKERFERGEVEKGADILLEEEAYLCACSFCEEWYFCTNISTWTSRNCGHYDGDNTWCYVHFGSEDLFAVTENLKSYKSANYNPNAITIRELIYGKKD